MKDPSRKRKNPVFSLKVVFAVTWEYPFKHLGNFPVLTNWCHCQGTKVHISPRRNDKKCKISRKRFLRENRIFYIREKVVTFSLATSHSVWKISRRTSWISREYIQEVILILKLCIVWKIQKKYLEIEIKKRYIFLSLIYRRLYIFITHQSLGGKSMLKGYCRNQNLNLT